MSRCVLRRTLLDSRLMRRDIKSTTYIHFFTIFNDTSVLSSVLFTSCLILNKSPFEESFVPLFRNSAANACRELTVFTVSIKPIHLIITVAPSNQSTSRWASTAHPEHLHHQWGVQYTSYFSGAVGRITPALSQHHIHHTLTLRHRDITHHGIQ